MQTGNDAISNTLRQKFCFDRKLDACFLCFNLIFREKVKIQSALPKLRLQAKYVVHTVCKLVDNSKLAVLQLSLLARTIEALWSNIFSTKRDFWRVGANSQKFRSEGCIHRGPCSWGAQKWMNRLPNGVKFIYIGVVVLSQFRNVKVVETHGWTGGAVSDKHRHCRSRQSIVKQKLFMHWKNPNYLHEL